VKIPKWTLPSNSRTRSSSLLFCANLHTVSMPSWQSVFSQNIQLLCTLLYTYAPVECPLGRALRILSDPGSPLTHSRVLLNASLCIWSMPLGRALQNSSKILSATVFPYTALPPRYSTTLRSSSELMIPVPVPTWHVFV
jgi:hypothetical protein